MYTKTVVTAMIAFVLAIGMTGLGAAVTTDVTYTGDGSYNMNFNGAGTGYCGVHTFTSNGEDHMGATWTNAQATGWQTMDTLSYDNPPVTDTWNCGLFHLFSCEETVASSGSNTDINRVITVGGMNDGADASGSIMTFTNDTNGNTLFSLATYKDDVAWTSHVTTEQSVSMYQDEYSSIYDKVGRITGYQYEHDEYEDSYTGVSGYTDISGFAYGADTLVTGLIRSESDDTYVYALVEMTQGEFDINMYTNAESEEMTGSGWYDYGWFGSGSYSYTDEYVGTNGNFGVDADGLGLFVFGAGEDAFGGYAQLYDDNGDLFATIDAYDGTFQAVTQINGSLWGTGYVYSYDI